MVRVADTAEPTPDLIALSRAAADRLEESLEHIVFRWGGGVHPGVKALSDNPRQKLTEFRVRPDGSWADFGGGGQGSDLISLVAYCGRCSRDRAAAYLADVVTRLPKKAA